MLRKTIQEVVGKDVTIVDSAEPTVEELKTLLMEQDLFNNKSSPMYKFYFTDLTEATLETANRFIGKDISRNVQNVKL